ncbi:hypothetical protein ABIF74_006019 [Bradyrhizobium japonicum]
MRCFGRGSRRRLRCFDRRHRRRSFRLHLGLGFDLGFARDRLGRRRRDLAMDLLRLLGRRLFRSRSMALGHGLCLRDHRLSRCGGLALVGLEGDVDDVILLVAEGVHVRIADQRDLDTGLVDVGLLLDRGDVRGRGDDGVRQIEIEAGIERERQLLLVEHGGHADAVGHLEHEAHESRLHRGAHADLRTLFGLCRGALGAQGTFGDTRTLGQFLDHVHGQAWWRPLPALR